MKNISLDNCTFLPVKEYINLVNPKFKAQTRADEQGCYWMIFESEGVLYKTFNSL